jgi:NADH-quinone oxidoreductase subunit J
MTLFSLIFYILAAMILMSTLIALTRRNLVHTAVYLVLSFFGSAMLFYLLGAPLLAAIEVIVYAGAIMILFIFIIMMLKIDGYSEPFDMARQYLPALIIAILFIVIGFLVLINALKNNMYLTPAMAWPKDFAVYLFQKSYLSIEIVSLLLLVALIAAFLMGKSDQESAVKERNK